MAIWGGGSENLRPHEHGGKQEPISCFTFPDMLLTLSGF